MKQIEILAPAGSYQSLIAAINASCDAVYIGGIRFGARAYADNLTEEEMLQAIDYAHIHNKKLYLTVNTLLKNKELEEELYDYLVKFYERGLDAVIVQDMGVLHFIHRNFPDLPIHASTQMTITMSKSFELLKEYGVTRVVTSRELSLEEINAISQSTDLEIESFVHGALCYCYSGQCLMSSMLGGRSGNRGRCAQPCRMPYSLSRNGKYLSKESEQYLLSPKDICTLELIPDLIDAGIKSFKIEGRMKRPEYTALASFLYRKYTDLYINLGRKEYDIYLIKQKEEFEQDIKNLMELYNRGGFTQGYYKTYNSKEMMSSQRPNHSGVLVGKVISLKGNRAKISLNEDIQGQDVLEFRNQNGEVLYEYTVKDLAKKNQNTETNFMPGSKITIGDWVYRTKNNVLLNEIAFNLLEKEDKVSIVGEFYAQLGEPMRFSLQCQGIGISLTGDIVEQAQKQPIQEEKIREQLNKTNNTSYLIEQLTVTMDSNIFIPVGKLNEIRREAIEELTRERIKQYHRALPKDFKQSITVDMEKMQRDSNVILNDTVGICVHVLNLSQLKSALTIPEVDSICLHAEDIDFNQMNQAALEVSKSHKSFYLVLPYIFRKKTYEMFEEAVLQKELILEDGNIAGFVIKNLEEYEFLHSHINLKEQDKKIVLDYNLYTMNKEAKEFWKKLGVDHFTSSIELNEHELRELGCEDSDVIVYGHTPLMTSTQCVVKNTIGCQNKEAVYNLIDRYKKNFYVVNNCRYCYNTIYNGIVLSLINYKKEISLLNPKQIRLDFTLESPDEIKRILKEFVEVFRYNKEVDTNIIKDYTKGHFKRGIE